MADHLGRSVDTFARAHSKARCDCYDMGAAVAMLDVGYMVQSAGTVVRRLAETVIWKHLEDSITLLRRCGNDSKGRQAQRIVSLAIFWRRMSSASGE